MELELLDISDLSNQYIRVSKEVEQSIIEGNYKNVFSIDQSIHDAFYKYYLNKFEDTIRFQIARSSEKSFDSLRTSDAIQLLNLTDVNQLKDFIRYETDSIENREIDWKIVGDRLHFIAVIYC
jgi:hypothetical protein